jgi:hypothetical protein
MPAVADGNIVIPVVFHFCHYPPGRAVSLAGTAILARTAISIQEEASWLWAKY